MKQIIYLLLISVMFIGCSTSQVDAFKSPSAGKYKVQRIGLMPSSGSLGDSIGFALMKYGYDVYDTNTMSNMMVRHNLTEIEMIMPKNISQLASEGIDAVLIAKTISGYDNKPNSASVKLLNTTTGAILVGATWQNGKGGARGSPADGMMRSGMNEASNEIAKVIGSQLKQ